MDETIDGMKVLEDDAVNVVVATATTNSVAEVKFDTMRAIHSMAAFMVF